MTSMFENNTVFNQDINQWNVSNVVRMGSMFYNAINFNKPIDSWRVSNVTDVTYMFYGASSFDQNIGSSWYDPLFGVYYTNNTIFGSTLRSNVYFTGFNRLGKPIRWTQLYQPPQQRDRVIFFRPNSIPDSEFTDPNNVVSKPEYY